MTLGLKFDNKALQKCIGYTGITLWVACIGLILVYFMGYVDSFLGATPLNRLSHDDKFNIGIVIGVYIILKIVGVLFISNTNTKS